MRRYLSVLLLCVMLVVPTRPLLAATPQVSVINNILAESIVHGPKGVRINGAIVKFTPGTAADFQSLTQFLVAEAGTYSVRLEIVGPDNKLRAYDGFVIDAGSANWTHGQLTHWYAVHFDVPGVYRFTVRVDNRIIGSYPLPASK